MKVLRHDVWPALTSVSAVDMNTQSHSNTTVITGSAGGPQSHATIKGTVHQKWTCAESVIACRSSEICFFSDLETCLGNESEWVPSE